jgi:hypothetical protein
MAPVVRQGQGLLKWARGFLFFRVQFKKRISVNCAGSTCLAGGKFPSAGFSNRPPV